MKSYHTPQEVIRWLKRNYKSTAKFHYFNQGGGCLFTRFIRNVRKDKNLIVCQGGDVRVDSGYFTSDSTTSPNDRGVIPFHDTFWGQHRNRLTRDEAIAKLEALSKVWS